ncbi:hypothetical protein [Pseudomonas boanensis]|uniref:hypothetical protein n=1 Tax=Metapseudomonas boanensis TaxID=2822138 RepID=UPI0035D417F1
MSNLTWLALTLAVGVATGCATTDRQVVSIPLEATPQNAGHIAQATLAAVGERTSISVFIGGVPLGTTRPLRLYTYIYPGSCGRLAAKPAFDMNNTVVTQRWSGTTGWWLSKSAPASLDQLRSGGYAIVVRTTPADGNRDIFCGNIT